MQLTTYGLSFSTICLAPICPLAPSPPPHTFARSRTNSHAHARAHTHVHGQRGDSRCTQRTDKEGPPPQNPPPQMCACGGRDASPSNGKAITGHCPALSPWPHRREWKGLHAPPAPSNRPTTPRAPPPPHARHGPGHGMPQGDPVVSRRPYVRRPSERVLCCRIRARCVPTMARPDPPNDEFHYFPQWSL